MKTITITLSLLFCLCLGPSMMAQTTVRLETPKCRGRMQVFAINGVGYYKVTDLKTFREMDESGETPVEKNVFTWEAPDTEPRIYFIGTSMRDYFPVLVGEDPAINVTGTCGQLRSVTISESPSNVAYQRMMQKLNQNNATYSNLAQAYRGAERDKNEAGKAKAKEQMVALDASKQKLVEDMKAQNPYLGRIAAMNTYLSYVNADKTKYPTGLQHYLATIWQFTDFKDADYADMNVVYEASANFANTLMSALPSDQIEKAAMAYANRWPEKSKIRMYALGGMFGTLNQRTNPAALKIADVLVSDYKEKYPNQIAAVEQNYNKLRTSTPGTEAPNFSGPNPAGETITLSDLRGKVVLLDFWASWCGPCRRENPNVVRMYEKYADKGFEILGVSLDRDKGRWEKAIADDGLNWLHVSDLKHWRSEYASLYGVRSIPDTILLDAEGKIIARNLRGAQLEQRLAQIFGEGK